jgi:HEAT repeat protein
MAGASGPAEWLSWLVSGDDAQVKQARLALGGIQPGDDVDVAPLVSALDSGHETLTFWALVALGCIGPAASSALKQIHALALHSAHIGTRQACAIALARIAPEDRAGIDTLLRQIADEHPFVRREALQALIGMKNLVEVDLAAIEAAASDPHPDVARWARIAIRDIDPATQAQASPDPRGDP